MSALVFELVAAERHRPRAPIVGPFTLAVPPASLCVLLGPSGSGKSTLLALLAGVEGADRGSVAWSGRDVTRASESSLALGRRGRIGVVGQSFALLEHLPVWQGVAIAGVVQGLPPLVQRERALAMLARLGIGPELAERRPRELSGGERQRAALARALLSSQVGLIADEPTSNQDAASAELVVEALLACRASGSALVVATHDPLLARAADQSMHLKGPEERR